MAEIYGFHAHIYYDEATFEQAKALIDSAAARFDLQVGRMHRQEVGPHPEWSCQLAFRPDLFGEIIPWLALNRAGLTVFIHPETGEDLEDHRDRAIWMGRVAPLKLELFQ